MDNQITMEDFQWKRTGDTVYVSGRLEIEPALKKSGSKNYKFPPCNHCKKDLASAFNILPCRLHPMGDYVHTDCIQKNPSKYKKRSSKGININKDKISFNYKIQ